MLYIKSNANLGMQQECTVHAIGSRILPIQKNHNTRSIITPPSIRGRSGHFLRDLPGPLPPRRKLCHVLHERLVVHVVADAIGLDHEHIPVLRREMIPIQAGFVG